MMHIRPERRQDAQSISQLTTRAFADAPHSGGNEARIVDALRDADALTLSLVAEAGEGIVGHIAFSPVRIDGRTVDWYGLGPVSVAPDLHGQGIGAALVREGLDRLRRIGARGCVVVGDPAYYGRFGFVGDPGLTYMRHASPYFQRLVLQGAPPSGDVIYHPAFSTE